MEEFIKINERLRMNEEDIRSNLLNANTNLLINSKSKDAQNFPVNFASLDEKMNELSIQYDDELILDMFPQSKKSEVARLSNEFSTFKENADQQIKLLEDEIQNLKEINLKAKNVIKTKFPDMSKEHLEIFNEDIMKDYKNTQSKCFNLLQKNYLMKQEIVSLKAQMDENTANLLVEIIRIK